MDKIAMPHTRTAIAFSASYALGFALGIKGPDNTVALLSAAGAATSLLVDIFGRGAVAQRWAIREMVGASFSTALTVAQLYNTYIQPVTFMGSMGLVGFTTGYLTGMGSYYISHPDE